METIPPNGSEVTPEEVGNTETSSGANKRGSCRKTWIFTLRGSDGSNGSITNWVRTHCDCAVWQLERGDDGYVHYQMTMTLKKKQRLSWLKNHLAKTVHAEVANNIDACFDYTQKSETRIAGPFYWPERVRAVRDPLDGKELFPWQREVLDIIADEPDGRTIHWYWDPVGNKGKTCLAKHLALKHDACVLGNGKRADIAHAVSTNPRIVVFAFPRDVENVIAYGSIESICDGIIFSGKYDSTTKIFDPPHLFVFANFAPCLRKMSSDKWHIVEIV